MRRPFAALALAAWVAIGLGGGAARAQGPALVPQHDTVVAYHLAPARGEPIDVLVSFQAGGRMFRMDLPDRTYMIGEVPTELLMLVVPAERTIADLPWAAGPQSVLLVDPQWSLVKKGEATVAGVRCTVWDAAKDPAHHQLCLTADGVLLRNQFTDGQGRRNLVEALGMKEQPVPQDSFLAPLGFQRFQPGAPGEKVR